MGLEGITPTTRLGLVELPEICEYGLNTRGNVGCRLPETQKAENEQRCRFPLCGWSGKCEIYKTFSTYRRLFILGGVYSFDYSVKGIRIC